MSEFVTGAGASSTPLRLTSALLAVLGLAGTANAAWRDSAWLYRKELTINGGNCGASPCIAAAQAGFPVLVSLGTDADLAVRAQDDGDDLLFTSADGTTKLDHEIESFDGVTGALVAWVRLPSLPAGTNTTIYLYYGNAAAPNQQAPAAVWDANYRGVWHFGSSLNDSTANANHGAAVGTPDPAAGRVGVGRNFDLVAGATGDGVNLGNPATLNSLAAYTFELWARPESLGEGSRGRIFNKGTGGTALGRVIYQFNSGTGNLAFEQGRSNDGSAFNATDALRRTAADTLPPTGWHHVALVCDVATNTQRILIDGVEAAYEATQVGAGAVDNDSTFPLYVGNRPALDRDFDGQMDEVRVSAVVRTDSWIRTQYNNHQYQGVGAGSFILALGPQVDFGDILLEDHTAGQEANRFTGASSVTAAELFAFQLTNNVASSRTVASLVLTLSNVGGVAQADFASLELVVDANANGTIDGGETTTVGGSGAVNAGVSTITFSTPFPALGAGATVRYVLRGNVSNLAGGDRFNLSLVASNVTLVSGIVSGSTTSASHVNGYAWRKPITIDNAMLGPSCSADLASFPVLVRISSDDALRTVANGGRVYSASGYDIAFRSESGTTLDHEIERYVPTTGELVAWVRVPTIALAADTTIYVYYGDPLITSPTANAPGVWGASHAAVWHLEAAPAEGVPGHLDSTSPGQTGTPLGFADGGGGTTASPGVAAGADYFGRETGATGTHNRIEVPSDASLTPPGDLSVSLWVRPDNIADLGNPLYVWEGGTFAYQFFYAAGVPAFQWQNEPQTDAPIAFAVTPVQSGTWHHLAGVRRGTTLEVYLNGALEGTQGGAVGVTNLTGDPLVIGAIFQSLGSLGGRVDEVRISSAARSQCWIETEYRNGAPGSTGVSPPGTEQAVGEVLLAEHPAGQESNKFGGGPAVAGAELFAFELENTAASARTVTSLVLPLASVSGIAQGDFASLRLRVDANGNGALDAGETVEVGGAGAVDGGVTTITFSTAFPALAAGQTVRYVLVGSVGSLQSGDRLTLSLGIANITLLSGTLGGASPSIAVHTALACCALSTVADATTVTVTGSGQFRLRFDTAFGGSASEFYDLIEAPAQDLAGGSGQDGLLSDEVTIGGTTYRTDKAGVGAKLDLLEATSVRVRVRGESYYGRPAPSTTVVAGLKGASDYTVHSGGRLALRFTRSATRVVNVDDTQRQLVVRYTPGTSPLDAWAAFSQSGVQAIPGPGVRPAGDDFVVLQNEQAGARTDFQWVLAQDWPLASSAFAACGACTSWVENSWYGPAESIAVGAQTWSSLLYFQPTNLGSGNPTSPWLAPEVTVRGADYRVPDAPAVTVGTVWQDPDELTGSDSFNEAEAAYLFNFDPATGLRFTMNGTTTNRVQPFFKIRRWRSFTPPATVSFDADAGGPGPASTLTLNTDYRAEIKPVSRASFASDLRWYSTLEAGTIAAPDVGPAGVVSGGLTTSPGRINGAGTLFDADGEFFRIPAAGQFDPQQGVIEFWYRPSYDYLASSGSGPDAGLFGYWNGVADFFYAYHESSGSAGLQFSAQAGGVASTVTVGAGLGVLWRANEWVHLRFVWDRPGSRLEVWVNGRLVGSGAYNAAPALPGDDWFYLGERNRDGTADDNAMGVIDELHVYSVATAPEPLADGGLIASATEYLRSGSRNFAYTFAPVGATRQGRYAYFGSDTKLGGLNVALATAGSSAGVLNLQWQFWNGTTWADLEAVSGFTDGTDNLTRAGSLFWTGDPPGWAPYSVNGGPDLYYVRAYLTNGSAAYSVSPTESVITTDVLLFQNCGGITTSSAEFAFGVPPSTAVDLFALEARGVSTGVEVLWRTASELDNLGFHLHRATSESGPWTRITPSLIPGLGSSPVGASYSHLDAEPAPGQRYYYLLEDVDTKAVSKWHGPVTAVYSPVDTGGGGGGGGDTEPGDGSGGDGPGSGLTLCPSWLRSLHSAAGSSPLPLLCTRHGDPETVSFEILSRTSRAVELELRTGGFWSVLRVDAGTTSLEGIYVRGFDTPTDPQALALPLRRALVEAVVGKAVRLVSAEALDFLGVLAPRPPLVGEPELESKGDGTLRPFRRRVAAARSARGAALDALARLTRTVFQGERKSAVLEVHPLRYDEAGGKLVLARRVRVRLAFTGVEPGETGSGSRGRLPARLWTGSEVLARLSTTRLGVHAARFEEVFPGRRRAYETSYLRLQREGEAVAFHVEPRGRAFAPGSVLYFHVERGARSVEFTGDVVYELVRSSEGRAMDLVPAAPAGAAVTTSPLGRVRAEVNRIYQPALLEAEDLWQWEGLVSGASRTKEFTLEGLDGASSGTARVVVGLQGGSGASLGVEDHHVEVLVNGVSAGGTRFSGKLPHRLELPFPASVLKEGVNDVSVVNVGDTGVASLVLLDWFEVRHPRTPWASGGVFDGEFVEEGTAEVGGLTDPAVVVDVTGGAEARWLVGFDALGGGVRFRAEAGRRYVVATAAGLIRPRVEQPARSSLRSGANQADYVLIGPAGFLGAAESLLRRREGQGLTVMAVSLEEIGSEFGYGKPSGEAIRRFVSHAYHEWRKPSAKYVVLLGDANYDPRRFVATSWASPLPALWGKTSYLWTSMDPAVGAVNGEDALPDLAVGRIPATTAEQAAALIGKLVAWEESGQALSGKVALVADDPDAAGDFEGDVEDVRRSFLGDREAAVLKVGELGSGTRAAIQEALDDGLSLLSYVGHGGSAVWASENVWNSWDAASLRAQSLQPVLLTMNCLNGYFVAPNFESLSESLLKVEGRGAVAAFSPSGLSLNGPAHEYHRALVRELAGGAHERLGDAVLAAQQSYAETGLMPELLSIYHLLGDPAMRIR